MSVDAELRTLDISIPAKPQVLVQLSLLLADDDVNLDAVAHLMEDDMALAAAVMKAVNSSLYGLKGRVQTAHQAVTYLGTREVVGIAYEMGLPAAFGPATALDPGWQPAAQRGTLMGRLAERMSLDAWAAHSAGLFEECGKAVLFRHAVDHYRAMLRAATSDTELASLEHVGFGVSHDALGAALCESWGLAPAAVASVRYHVGVQATGVMPPELSRRSICAVSAVVQAIVDRPEDLDDTCARLAPQADLEPMLLLRAARRVAEQFDEAREHARAA